MSKPVASHHIPPAQPSIVQQAQSYLFSPLGLILLCGTILAVVSIGGGKPKGKLANAYWGSATEKGNAQKKGKAQLRSPKVGSTTLYINTPASIRRKHRNWVIQEIRASLRKRGVEEAEIAQKLHDAQPSLPAKVSPLANDKTIFFPDVQAGTAVFGADSCR